MFASAVMRSWNTSAIPTSLQPHFSNDLELPFDQTEDLGLDGITQIDFFRDILATLSRTAVLNAGEEAYWNFIFNLAIKTVETPISEGISAGT